LFAGVWIDRFPKRAILLVTQAVSMLLALVLAVLCFTGTVRYEHVLLLTFLLGATNAFDMPTRQSITIEMVGKDDLTNAIALNSTAFNLARIVGPSIGAVMMALLGAGWCFLLNGLSFLPVLFVLVRIRLVPYVRKRPDTSVLSQIREGLVYMAKDHVLARTILLVTVVGTLAYNYNVLLPVLTRNVLHLGERTYGALMSAVGAGSLLGAIVMSMNSKRGPRMTVIAVSSVSVSILLGLNGLLHSPVLLSLMLAATGFGSILLMTNSNSMLQLRSSDEYRARILSVYAFVFAGSTPLGNVVTGSLAGRFGADYAFVFSGLLSLVGCLVILMLYRNKSRKRNVMPG
jgi:predicted MFS family arabinose efflux permease